MMTPAALYIHAVPPSRPTHSNFVSTSAHDTYDTVGRAHATEATLFTTFTHILRAAQSENMEKGL